MQSVAERAGGQENISKGFAPGTSALALGDLVRLNGIPGYRVVSKFFRSHIVFMTSRNEGVCHRGTIPGCPRYKDRAVEPG
jgi:hypothetical protein